MTTGTLKGRLLLFDDVQAKTNMAREVSRVKTWKRMSVNSRVEITQTRIKNLKIIKDYIAIGNQNNHSLGGQTTLILLLSVIILNTSP